jgi:hypothetical protein
MIGLIRALWRGEVPLARAFWVYLVGGGLIVSGSSTVAAWTLLASDAPVALAIAVFATSIPYSVFVLVAVLRSADRYRGPRSHADLARAAAIVWTILAVVL